MLFLLYLFASFLAFSDVSYASTDFAAISSSFFPLIFAVFVFYFLLIRPQQIKAKNHRLILLSIQIDDRVVLSSGIHGVISSILDDHFMVRIATDVEVLIDKDMISKFDIECIKRVKLNEKSLRDFIVENIPNYLSKKKVESVSAVAK